MKSTVLIDTNVLIDFLLNRTPFNDLAENIFDLCDSHRITGYISTTSVTDTFYICRKDFTVQNLRELFLELDKIAKIVSIDRKSVIEALNDIKFDDFEDCVQSECATFIGANYIITRNTDDYKNSIVKAISPSDFLKNIEI